MNPSVIEDTKYYLGHDVGKWYYEGGSYAWNMWSNEYLEKYIKNLEKKIDADGFSFKKKLSGVNYSPKHQY